jgi:hypothetical protein
MRIIIAISLLGSFAVCTTVHADECFCLQSADRAIVRGCEANGEFFLCEDPYTRKKSALKISSDWKRVEAGTDPCTVCRAPAGRIDRPEGLRGDKSSDKEQR